eukprot:791527-Pyramimonas_sp.AAC.1
MLGGLWISEICAGPPAGASGAAPDALRAPIQPLSLCPPPFPGGDGEERPNDVELGGAGLSSAPATCFDVD